MISNIGRISTVTITIKLLTIKNSFQANFQRKLK